MRPRQCAGDEHRDAVPEPQGHQRHRRVEGVVAPCNGPGDEFTVRIYNRIVADIVLFIDIRLVGLLEGISIRNITLSLDNATQDGRWL